MQSKKLLIASSSRNEAITQWVLNNKSLNSKIDLIFIEDLLQKYNISDILDDTSALIRWYKDNELKFSNKTHHLLNRITYINDSLFSSFHIKDREYAKREFEAYLGFALNSFKCPQKVAINGACERIYSLPQQWCLVHKFLNLKIPEYYWGNKEIQPFANDPNTIYSNIFDFLNWNTTEQKSSKSNFCFKKPNGKPVFILSIGTSHLINQSDHQINEEEISLLESCLQQIRNLFGFFIFELLIFIDDKEITFGCINSEIIRSRHLPVFEDFLNQNLLKEYYQCLN